MRRTPAAFRELADRIGQGGGRPDRYVWRRPRLYDLAQPAGAAHRQEIAELREVADHHRDLGMMRPFHQNTGRQSATHARRPLTPGKAKTMIPQDAVQAEIDRRNIAAAQFALTPKPAPT